MEPGVSVLGPVSDVHRWSDRSRGRIAQLRRGGGGLGNQSGDNPNHFDPSSAGAAVPPLPCTLVVLSNLLIWGLRILTPGLHAHVCVSPACALDLLHCAVPRQAEPTLNWHAALH